MQCNLLLFFGLDVKSCVNFCVFVDVYDKLNMATWLAKVKSKFSNSMPEIDHGIPSYQFPSSH